jgi:hypothetical protein
MNEIPTPKPASRAHRIALIAGIVTFALGPICAVIGLPLNGYINRISEYRSGLYPFYAFGVMYGVVILTALGLGITGLVKSRGTAEPRKVYPMVIIGLVLTILSLCCLLVIWGGFAVLPCGVFGC